MENFNANLKKISTPGVHIARGFAAWRREAARLGCHHFGVTSFYDISNEQKKTTTICLISLEIFGTVE